jgi:hypothetical protein
MSKQILKGLTMLVAIITIALATAAVSANAQNRVSVAAEIPFDFVVGNAKLPAGSYRVKTISDTGDALLISNRDGKASAVRLSKEIQDNDHAKVCLMFRRYGDQYFLSEVWTGQTARSINKSNRERALERELSMIAAKTELAEKSYELIQVVATLR